MNVNEESYDLFKLVNLDNIFDIRSKTEFIKEDIKETS